MQMVNSHSETDNKRKAGAFLTQPVSTCLPLPTVPPGTGAGPPAASRGTEPLAVPFLLPAAQTWVGLRERRHSDSSSFPGAETGAERLRYPRVHRAEAAAGLPRAVGQVGPCTRLLAETRTRLLHPTLRLGTGLSPAAGAAA